MHNSPRLPEGAEPPSRHAWEPPTLRPAGTLGEVLKGGTNKVTVVSGDPGEPQKIPGNDL